MMTNFNGKTALITGATGSIGEEIARAFYASGAHVVLSGTREQKLKELTESLGDRAYYETCDLSDKDSVKDLYARAEVYTGRVDILVCNAGITKDNLLLRMSDDDFSAVINTNLTAAFILNKAAVKKMLKQQNARIINIASVVGFTGNPGQANYCASKAGLVGMTKSIAQEVASRGVTVNAIAPGFIMTPMTDKLSEEQKEKLRSRIPCQRFGTPADVANCALFLADEKTSYITGHTIHVNGGMFMS